MDFTKFKFQLAKWGFIVSGCLNIVLIAAILFLVLAYIPRTKNDDNNSESSSSTVSSSSSSSSSSTSSTSNSTSTSTAERSQITFEFNNGKSITFKTSKATEQNKEFFNRQIKIISEDATVDELYNLYPNEGPDFFVEKQNTYYTLYPSGYSVMKVITDSDLEKYKKGEITKSNDIETKSSCSTSTYKIGNSDFTALKCVEEVKYEGMDDFATSSTRVQCLYPFSTGTYFYFGVESAEVGSDTNMCNTLEYYNVTGVDVK